LAMHTLGMELLDLDGKRHGHTTTAALLITNNLLCAGTWSLRGFSFLGVLGADGDFPFIEYHRREMRKQGAIIPATGILRRSVLILWGTCG
jgi:hypothetical protein